MDDRAAHIAARQRAGTRLADACTRLRWLGRPPQGGRVPADGARAVLGPRQHGQVPRHANRFADRADCVGALCRAVPGDADRAERAAAVRSLWHAQARLGAFALPADGRDDGVQLPGLAAPAPRSDGDGDLPRAADRRAARRAPARRVGGLAPVRGDSRGLHRHPDRSAPGLRPASRFRLRVWSRAGLLRLRASHPLSRGLRQAARHAVLLDPARHIRAGAVRTLAVGVATVRVGMGAAGGNGNARRRRPLPVHPRLQAGAGAHRRAVPLPAALDHGGLRLRRVRPGARCVGHWRARW